LSIFIAVAESGSGNQIMSSPDGINWTSRTSAADNAWVSVAWAPELSIFVAVARSGTGNRVMTSSDGKTWASRASAADNAWVSVAWAPELSIFVAVAENGTGNRVMTSPDGITWTVRTSASDNNWWTVVWAPELSIFVAVAYTATGNQVMTSAIGMPNSKSVVKALPSQMTVLPNGNVGIGTINPQAKLHVHNGNLNIEAVGTRGSGAQSFLDFSLFQNGINHNYELKRLGRISGIDSTSGTYYGDLAFYTAGDLNLSEVMRMKNNGNVGIGTTNPQEKLSINGNMFSSNFKTYTSSVVLSSTSVTIFPYSLFSFGTGFISVFGSNNSTSGLFGGYSGITSYWYTPLQTTTNTATAATVGNNPFATIPGLVATGSGTYKVQVIIFPFSPLA
jgi:hypothetical protein